MKHFPLTLRSVIPLVLLGTLLDELEDQDLTAGLVILCIGGGMGIGTIIERI